MSNLPELLKIPIVARELALLVSGNMQDYLMVGDEPKYIPVYLLTELRNASYDIISFAKGAPPNIHGLKQMPVERQKALVASLQKAGLHPLPDGGELEEPQKLRSFLNKLRRWLLTPASDFRRLLHIDYIEHLTGNGQAGMETPEEIILLEFLHSLAISPALKKSGNVVLLYLYDGDVPPKLQDYYQIEVPYPAAKQTEMFIQYLLKRDGYAKLASELTIERLAELVKGLPLKSTERMFRHAAARSEQITQSMAVHEKGKIIIKISENTLSMVESGELVSFDDVIGMRVVKRVLAQLADLLYSGRPAARGLMLVGPPGTCKTVLVYLTAQRAQMNCLKFEQIKDALVGRSEYLVRKALSLIIASAPTMVLLDEIDKMIPGQQQGVADGGVSSDQLAQFLQFMARDDLRHKRVVFCATSNSPQNLSTALQDRFTILPVLGVIPDEIPELLDSYVKRLNAKKIDDDRTLLRRAGEILYTAGASARQMLDVIQHCVNFKGRELSCADIVEGCQDFSGQTDPAGVSAAILQSIAMCSFRSWYAWADNPDYPLPACLQGVVDVKNNTVDHAKLNQRLQEVMPYAQL